MFTRPEAAPESAAGTPASDAVVSGTNTRPIPRPTSSIGPKMPDQYTVSGDTRDSQAIPVMAGTIPVIISGFGPSSGMSLGAALDAANSAMVSGRNATPARSGLNPMTLCRNWVRKKNIPNMPAMSSSREMNEPARLTSVNRRIGVIGCRARVSVITNPASRTAARPNATSATWSSQPSDAARMNPYTSDVTPAVAVSAPARSKRPGCRGVSVTNSGVTATTARPIGTLMNSTHRQDSHSVITPPSTRPNEEPPVITPM